MKKQGIRHTWSLLLTLKKWLVTQNTEVMDPFLLRVGRVQVSHNQNLVHKWCTQAQNHVKSLEGGRSYLWLGSSLTNLHLPGF